MVYQPQREKIVRYIENSLIPVLKDKEVDYSKTISYIANEVGVSEKVIEEVIQLFIKNDKLKEIRSLSLSDQKLLEYLKHQK